MKTHRIVDRVLTAGLVALALVFLIEFSIWCFSPVDFQFDQKGNITSFSPEDATAFNATITSDGYYSPTAADSQLYFDISGHETKSILVNLGKSVDYSTSFQLFYSKSGMSFTEENSIVQPVNKQMTSIAFTLPGNQYDTIRLDIDIPVILNDLAVSDGEIITTTHSYILNFVRIALETLAFFAVLLLLFNCKRISKFFDSLNTNIIKLFSLITFFFTYLLYREIKDAIAIGVNVKCFVLFIHLFVLALIALMMYFLKKKHLPLEKLFVMIAIPLAIVYMFVITPLAVPDEPHHYHTSYELSNYMLFRFDEIESGDALDFDYYGLTPHYNTVNGYERLISEFFSPRSESKKIIIPSPRNLSYPVMHLPQALGLFIGRLTGANFLILFYLGRLFNILFYSLCSYWAIKLVPKQKSLFFALSLMPMALHQAASYSYDAFINGMVLLYIALILRAIALESRMERREYLALLNVGMLIAPAKVIYVSFLLLTLLIPKQRFGSRKQKILAISGFCAAAMIFMIIWWLPGFIKGDALTTLPGGDVYTVSYILHNPLSAVDILLRSFKDNFVFWMNQAVGYNLAGLSLGLPQYIPFFYLLLLFILSIRSKNETVKCISTEQRVAFLSVGMIISLLTLLIMFLTWTFITSTTVTGIQGRYFIPVLPLLYLALENKSIVRNKTLDMPLLLTCLILNVAVIDNVLQYTLYH